ncbi:FG-GAP-like repeat-containing protein, partial [Myxococcus virescens]
MFFYSRFWDGWFAAARMEWSVRRIVGVWSCLAALATGSLGCGEGAQELASSEADETVRVPTWEEFLASSYFAPSRGVYIANGDEVFRSQEELRSYYDAHVEASAHGVTRSPLAVRISGGQRSVWSAAQKRHLTYCVDSASLGVHYAQVVHDLGLAMRKWEAAADVKFVHLSQYDGDCGPTQENVVFDVFMNKEPIDFCEEHPVACWIPVEPGGPALPSGYSRVVAMAFYPDFERSDRRVELNRRYVIYDYALVAKVLTHEVGHILGFPHEHLRISSSNPDCSESELWEGLTAYDSESVMNYPQCGGLSTYSRLSLLDRIGARSVYGPSQVPGADFNGDAYADIFRYDTGTGQVETRYGNAGTGDLLFSASSQKTWIANLKMIPGDFNGDGNTDIFRYNTSTGEVEIRYGRPEMDEFLFSALSQVTWIPGLELIPGDFNGDGFTDIFRYRPSTGEVEIRYGSAIMTELLFSPSSQQTWVGNLKMIPGDFNGDGYTDIFRYYMPTGEVEIRYGNSGMGALSFSATSQETWVSNLNLVAGDFNGDGYTDIF